MGPDLTSLPRTTACPSCGGALRPEATWCSLCFYDFRAVSAPAPAAAPEPVLEQYGVPAPLSYGVDPLTGPLLDVALPQAVPAPAPVPAAEATPEASEPAPRRAAAPAWPCARCGERNSFETIRCGACGGALLESASPKPSLVIPGVGDLMAMSRGRRAGVAAMAVAALLVPLAVLTLVLTGSPPPSQDSGSAPSSTPNTPYVTVVPPQQQVPGP